MNQSQFVMVSIANAVDFMADRYKTAASELSAVEREIAQYVDEYESLNWFQRNITSVVKCGVIQMQLDVARMRYARLYADEHDAYIDYRYVMHQRATGQMQICLYREHFADYFEWLDERNAENMKKQIIVEGEEDAL